MRLRGGFPGFAFSQLRGADPRPAADPQVGLARFHSHPSRNRNAGQRSRMTLPGRAHHDPKRTRKGNGCG